MKTKKGGESEILTLPTERTTPSHRLADYSILLYAPPKWGKTTLANCFPKPVFAETERGTKSLSVYREPIKNWKRFMMFIRALEKSGDFSTVVVDTVDYLYKWCEDYVCEELAIDHLSEEGFARGWDRLRSEFTVACNRITATQRGVIFISHADEKIVKRMREETMKVVPSMARGALKVVHPLCDIVAYGHYDENGNRVLQIRGNEDVLAGHRLTNHFVGVKEIKMGTTPEEGYANFLKAFAVTSNNNSNAQPKGGGEKKKVLVIKR
jgi:hypothetical protein